MHSTTGIRRSPENPEYEGGPEKTPSEWEHDASMTEIEAPTSTRKAVRSMRHANRLVDAVRTFIPCLLFFIVCPQGPLTQQLSPPPFFCCSRFRAFPMGQTGHGRAVFLLEVRGNRIVLRVAWSPVQAFEFRDFLRVEVTWCTLQPKLKGTTLRKSPRSCRNDSKQSIDRTKFNPFSTFNRLRARRYRSL